MRGKRCDVRGAVARRVLTVDKRLCEECGLMRAPSPSPPPPRDINYLPRGISLPRASRVADTMIDASETRGHKCRNLISN